MAIYSEKNLYPGINAHLNGYLQNTPGGWESFHSAHIDDLTRIIDENLPDGYYTLPEKSLQVGEIDRETGSATQKRTKADVTIFSSAASPTEPAFMRSSSPVISIPVIDTFNEEQNLTGIVIYQAGEGYAGFGRPITRVELLSPSNKPGSAHYEQYSLKRAQTLQSGLRLAEIDYLHETPPIIAAVPSYADHEENAFSYMILVSDPRPRIEEGVTNIYAISVDQILPTIDLPLAGADRVKINFSQAHNQTFEKLRFFRMVADYAKDPVGLERYSRADQERIREILAEIRRQYQKQEQ